MAWLGLAWLDIRLGLAILDFYLYGHFGRPEGRLTDGPVWRRDLYTDDAPAPDLLVENHLSPSQRRRRGFEPLAKLQPGMLASVCSRKSGLLLY